MKFNNDVFPIQKRKPLKRLKKTRAEETDVGKTEISRKDAIKKIGLMAFSASTMILLLNEPAKGQEEDPEDSPDSPDNPPEWP